MLHGSIVKNNIVHHPAFIYFLGGTKPQGPLETSPIGPGTVRLPSTLVAFLRPDFSENGAIKSATHRLEFSPVLTVVVMVALWNRADHYIFILILSFFLSSFFSSPNLSGLRLDVYQ